jgi:proteic killer suppression protein
LKRDSQLRLQGNRIFFWVSPPGRFRRPFADEREPSSLTQDASTNLKDLKSPPGNRLEALGGNRKGQHSIRINQQYRLCFRWSEHGADQVIILDYH